MIVVQTCHGLFPGDRDDDGDLKTRWDNGLNQGDVKDSRNKVWNLGGGSFEEVIESIRECLITVIGLQDWFVVSDGEDALPYTVLQVLLVSLTCCCIHWTHKCCFPDCLRQIDSSWPHCLLQRQCPGFSVEPAHLL